VGISMMTKPGVDLSNIALLLAPHSLGATSPYRLLHHRPNGSPASSGFPGIVTDTAGARLRQRFLTTQVCVFATCNEIVGVKERCAEYVLGCRERYEVVANTGTVTRLPTIRREPYQPTAALHVSVVDNDSLDTQKIFQIVDIAAPSASMLRS
jgi:hypothetical protein